MSYEKKGIQAGKNVILNCMGADLEEQLLIVTDEEALDAAQDFVDAGRQLGISTVLMEMQKQNGREPPKSIAYAMMNADIALLVTSFSLSHTLARHEATSKGVRIASMPMITKEIVENCLDTDYKHIEKISDKLAKMLTNGYKVRITTEKGTDLTIDICDRKGIADTGILTDKGSFGNLPAGEALIAPLEGKGDGMLVVDGAVAGIGKIQEPITLTLKDGKVINVIGGTEAEKYKNMLKGKDENAWKIAELGIGTNEVIKLMGNALVDEKVFGTVHIGFGNNKFMGGEQDSSIHYDCIIMKPDVYIDGEIIIKKGMHTYK